MKLIKLTKFMCAQVDDEDYEWLSRFKWDITKGRHTYYAENRILGRMHRVILNTPIELQVDHIDHNGLNNQRDNIRNCTNNQNQWNRKKRKGNAKYIGVNYFINGKYKYIRAQIKVNGKKIFLGNFKTEEAAAHAYDNAARLYHGEFANLNFKN